VRRFQGVYGSGNPGKVREFLVSGKSGSFVGLDHKSKGFNPEAIQKFKSREKFVYRSWSLADIGQGIPEFRQGKVRDFIWWGGGQLHRHPVYVAASDTL